MTFDECQPIPLYVTPHRQRKHLVNLLLLTDDERDVHHYVLVRDLSRLVRSRTKHHGKAFVCEYCLHCFRCEHTLTEHIPNCSTHTPQTVTYPVKGKDAVLHYKTTQKEFPVPYVLYVDFESFIEPSADRDSVSEHVPSGFCCLKVSKFDDEIFEPHVYHMCSYLSRAGCGCLHMVQLMPLPSHTPPSLASFKCRLILPFRCRLTQVVLEKRPLNGCSVVVVVLE